MIYALQFFLLCGLIATAFMVLRLRDLLSATIAMAAFGLLLSLEFYLLHAPDVAIAEASIGAGLTTAIFIIAIRATTRKKPAAPQSKESGE